MMKVDESPLRLPVEHGAYITGQIIATSHDLAPQKVAKEGIFSYFR